MNHKSDVEAWATALILKRLRSAKGLKQYQFADEIHNHHVPFSPYKSS